MNVGDNYFWFVFFVVFIEKQYEITKPIFGIKKLGMGGLIQFTLQSPQFSITVLGMAWDVTRGLRLYTCGWSDVYKSQFGKCII